MSKILYCFV